MFGVDSELLHYSGCRKSQLAPDPGPLGAELDRLVALTALPLVELWMKCCSYSCSMKEIFMVFILIEDIYMAELCFVRTFFGRVLTMIVYIICFYIWPCFTLVGSLSLS